MGRKLGTVPTETAIIIDRQNADWCDHQARGGEPWIERLISLLGETDASTTTVSARDLLEHLLLLLMGGRCRYPFLVGKPPTRKKDRRWLIIRAAGSMVERLHHYDDDGGLVAGWR